MVPMHGPKAEEALHEPDGRDIALRCPRPRSSGRKHCAAARTARRAAAIELRIFKGPSTANTPSPPHKEERDGERRGLVPPRMLLSPALSPLRREREQFDFSRHSRLIQWQWRGALSLPGSWSQCILLEKGRGLSLRGTSGANCRAL